MTKKSSTRPLSMKQMAYQELLKRILSGNYAPGSLLNRRGVAEELSMSSAPVHEAMIQLESEGLLEALPRQGTRVCIARREDVRGYLVVREALECQAVRMICGTLLPEALERLRPLAEAADSMSIRNSEMGLQTEVSFHLALVEMASCPVLSREYRKVMQLGLFYRINILQRASTEPESLHLRLLDDLLTATSDAAAEFIRLHIRSGKSELLLTPASSSSHSPLFI